MSREIKFRVWDNIDYMSTPFTLYDIQEKKIEFTHDVKIMQFTGLFDRHGKEIYASDVLARNGYKHQEVWFEDGAFLIGIRNDSDMPFFQAMAEEMEVIGNIYQNPELLK